ncbi:MAG: 50S ribosome-binding GTPase [Deltaproteobacteria bacterium]|nr:50S ribosome-binding GTPase [Deltaproteobacteria bacterium]MBI3388312.1 50S ribosome-binding GTPase [Deltaproteobacteria bacterium]
MAEKGLSNDELVALRREILKEVDNNPPTIGIVGVSGVGKSSTVNALFKTLLPVSHTVACTKTFTKVDLSLQFRAGQGKDLPVSLRVFDAPGLGEDIERDPPYIRMYTEALPQCDAVIWVTAARNRAIALDQQYLRLLSAFHGRLVFGLNQVDLVDPLNWNEKINLPSPQQVENIDEICRDRAERFASILGREVTVTPFSAARRYNLEEMFGSIIDSCMPKRRWVLDGLKGFHYADFLPVAIRDRFFQDQQG